MQTTAGDRLGGLEIEPAQKHRPPAKYNPLRFAQQCMRPYASIIRSYCAATDCASGWLNPERSSVLTHGHEDFGVMAMRLVAYWVRQRCQSAPGRVAPIADKSPA